MEEKLPSELFAEVLKETNNKPKSKHIHENIDEDEDEEETYVICTTSDENGIDSIILEDGSIEDVFEEENIGYAMKFEDTEEAKRYIENRFYNGETVSAFSDPFGDGSILVSRTEDSEAEYAIYTISDLRCSIE